MITFQTTKSNIKRSRIVSFNGFYARLPDGWCRYGYAGDGVYIFCNVDAAGTRCGIKEDNFGPWIYRFSLFTENAEVNGGELRYQRIFLDANDHDPSLFFMHMSQFCLDFIWMRIL